MIRIPIITKCHIELVAGSKCCRIFRIHRRVELVVFRKDAEAKCIGYNVFALSIPAGVEMTANHHFSALVPGVGGHAWLRHFRMQHGLHVWPPRRFLYADEWLRVIHEYPSTSRGCIQRVVHNNRFLSKKMHTIDQIGCP